MSLAQVVKDTVTGGVERIGTAAQNVTLNAKQAQLNEFTLDHTKNRDMKTYFGVKVSDTDTALKAGVRGPTLLEDTHAREKINQFDHERIPERAVHARGAGAHGYFKLNTAVPEYTHAEILNDTTLTTPVFVRFSTVGGSRGSADTVRDPRGFAVRMYTQQGNWDIVGNNNPVFFIQESIKFPDLIHAVKPEPNKEIPQAQSAHDNFWDFISLTPESLHMIMWHMSDRNIPRSYRMMQGFGVHSFILTNAQNEHHFVKFHWRPKLGTHSLVWDEALKLAGQDPDFHRRDLWDAIEAGSYPEYELGIQCVPESKEHEFDFDLLDSTKIIPEELVPIKWIGTLVLNSNPTEYFTETEQVAFCTQHLVPGIDHSNDPLLHLRSFSYQDTQLSRLGSINFHQIPINRPICPVFNNQRDGAMRMTISKGPNYWPNRFNTPHPVSRSEGGYVHEPTALPAGVKERVRGPKFSDHTSQARLFWNSMSAVEKVHIIEALSFELQKVEDPSIKEKMVQHFNKIDNNLATAVAAAVDVPMPKPEQLPAIYPERSEYLSQLGQHNAYTAQGRKVGIFVLDGFDYTLVASLKAAFMAEGVMGMLVGPRKGTVSSSPTREGGTTLTTQFTFDTCRSTHFDAVLFVGGGDGDSATTYIQQMRKNGRLLHAAREAFMHKKMVGATGSAVEWLARYALPGEESVANAVAEMGDGVAVNMGVVVAAHSVTEAPKLVSAINGELAKHRCWERDTTGIAA